MHVIDCPFKRGESLDGATFPISNKASRNQMCLYVCICVCFLEKKRLKEEGRKEEEMEEEKRDNRKTHVGGTWGEAVLER